MGKSWHITHPFWKWRVGSLFYINCSFFDCATQLRSQSLNRCLAPAEKVTCLTCNSKQWLRSARRLLSGVEKLGLQGLLVNRHRVAISETPETNLHFLSGNAVCFFNQAQALVAALSCLDFSSFSRWPLLQEGPLVISMCWWPLWDDWVDWEKNNQAH